ncbi:hypothetical protein D9758_015961 [Tetrapyrgos nigripes]|uniref:NAD(P)-binding protein n=1 Tax=Tetrapyrgos nigripes TaxID=182062 RepID=A0A8H5FDX5_9AGAR|nr:hypothetical protein D9758_015961 [Tetrapyrgos nigripes]
MSVNPNPTVALKLNPNFVLEPAEPVVNADLGQRIVVVLGANVGLGFEASKHFARMTPAKLVMACRSEAKGKEAVEGVYENRLRENVHPLTFEKTLTSFQFHEKEVKKATGFEAIELRIIDLSSFASVRDFANKYVKEIGQLDILVANAAMLPVKYESTVDGWETSLQVNYLSLALLTFLLLPSLIDAAKEAKYKPRIVVISSSMHEQTQLDDTVIRAHSILKQMNDEHYAGDPEIIKRRYSDTKLFGVFFVCELNERLSRSNPSIIINVTDPGRCESHLSRNFPDAVKQQIQAMNLQKYTTEEGSRALVYGAVGEVGKDNEEELRGAHIRRTRKIQYGEFVVGETGQNLQKRLWNELIETLCKADTEVEEVIVKYSLQ